MWFWCYGGSYLFHKYSSLHSRSLNNICTVAISGQILASCRSWRAVELFHRLHSPYNPKPQPAFSQDILIIPQLFGREVKNHCRLRDYAHFFHFLVFLIANQDAVSRSAALVLRIKALALKKRPLFVLFAIVGRIAAILDVAMLCAVEGAQCKTTELP